ncbi:MAG: molybdopterin molybdotransferase MoeA [Anaerolineales bacterium]|nr:molybdopterin molybdotransferase MoeA [Anaerolineales bacterium]
MPEFLQLSTLAQALDLWLEAAQPLPLAGAEAVPTESALGRILAEDVRATSDLPPFRRTTVDGYAVRGADTFGANPSLPSYLRLVGEVPMGAPANLALEAGTAALVHTGGMLPEASDAVVMIEDTQRLSESEIEVLRPVQVGANVLQQGEDVRQGEIALRAGSPLRPQEIGALMALGILHVACRCRIRVGLLSSGDEVVPPTREPGPGQVRDVNEGGLRALVALAGGQAAAYGIVPDDPVALESCMRRAAAENHFVIVSAGSSVSVRDSTAEVIRRLGPPGVLVHGLRVKPGKPTILAMAGKVPILGLPGNPVSALILAHCLAVPMIQAMLGARRAPMLPSVSGRLSENVPSEAGREDFVPVSLDVDQGAISVSVVHGRSNLIFTLTRADGFLRIPPQATGLRLGSQVEVYPFPGGLAWPAPIGSRE